MRAPQQPSGGWCVSQKDAQPPKEEAQEEEQEEEEEGRCPPSSPPGGGEDGGDAAAEREEGDGEGVEGGGERRNIGNIGNIKGRGENGIKPTDFRKGKKKNASQHVSQPEASAPATVQLQVDPERRGAFSLYQSRGFVVVPQPYTLQKKKAF